MTRRLYVNIIPPAETGWLDECHAVVDEVDDGGLHVTRTFKAGGVSVTGPFRTAAVAVCVRGWRGPDPRVVAFLDHPVRFVRRVLHHYRHGGHTVYVDTRPRPSEL